MTSAEFEIEVDESRAPSVILTVQGDLDVYTSPRLRDVWVGLVDQGRRHVVLDLNKVDFVDSTGLGVIVGGQKRLKAGTGILSIVCDRPNILKLFEITGLSGIFSVHANVEQALLNAG